MSECTDQRFEKMLHLYELDLLPETDREEFEQHLLDCDHCFESVQQFQKVARHLRSSPNVQASIDNMVRGRDGKSSIELSPKRNWGRIARNSLAAAAILVLLVLRPWQMTFEPDNKAYAAENRLAVMYFANLVDENDPDRLGEIISSLLITDLSESQFLQVMSTQRLFDALRLLGKEDQKVVDPTVASQVAEKLQARWMLTGDIVSVDPQLIVTAQLVEVSTGEVVASQKVTGELTDNIFSVVDALTIEVKEDMKLPIEAMQEQDRMIADVTTHSPEAYRHYVEGLEHLSKVYRPEAIKCFENAVAADSTFAMAYFHLARTKNANYINEAVKYADNASLKGQLFIKAKEAAISGDYDSEAALLVQIIEQYPDEKEAYYEMGAYHFRASDYDSALHRYDQAIAIDPLYKQVYNQLAYTHHRRGEFDRAIWAINEYIRLAPDEANPYDTRGEIYASNGHLDKALESFRQALQRKSDFVSSLRSLGHCYVYKGDYESADSCYRVMMNSDSYSFQLLGRLSLTYIPLYQGKYTEALVMADSALDWYAIRAADDERPPVQPSLTLIKSLILEEQGRFQEAVIQLQPAIDYLSNKEYPDSMSFRDHYARMLTLAGDLETASEVMQAHKDYLDRRGFGPCYYHYGSASIEMHGHDPEAAIEHLESAAALTGPESEFFGRYYLALTYLEVDNVSRTVEILEQQFNYFDEVRLFRGGKYVKMHYYLGLAYEKSRWFDKAIEQYEIFLGIYKNADSGIAEVQSAQERLAALRSAS